MPNHFHFMLMPNESGCKGIILGDKDTHIQALSKTIGKTLSSYTQAINIQNKTTGNLFQKKTKAKLLTEEARVNDKFTNQDYLLTCFHYIHQNPVKANLVWDLRDWPYLSYPDYYGHRNGTICNKAVAMQLLSLSVNDFLLGAEIALDDSIIKLIF